MKNGANLRGWEPDNSWHKAAAETLTDWKSWNKMVPLLMETVMAHRKLETKEMSVTELELKTGRYLERSDLNWLCREIWRKRRALKRDQGECGDGESPQENAEQAFQLELDCKRRKSRICSHKILPRPLLDSGRPGRINPIRETPLGGVVEKHENGLCWWNVDLAKENGKCLEEAEKRERVTGSDHSRCFESIASRMFGEARKVFVVDVLGYEFPEDWLCSMTVMAPKVVGATCLTKFRQIAGLCAMRKVLSYVWLKSEIRECANGICAEDACGRWIVSADAGSRVVERMAKINCGRATGLEESVRPCGPPSGLQGNETARCELVFDGFDCGDLEWKLHEGALGNGDVEQSSDEPGTSSRSAGISSHLHNDHGIGAARLDKELDFKETGLEIGRCHAGCDLPCGRCGVDCCIGVCCRNNGVRSDRKTERGWPDCWCTENTLDKFSEDDRQKHHGGGSGCGVGGSFGVCGIDDVSGRECKTCDRTQILAAAAVHISSSGKRPRRALSPQGFQSTHRKTYSGSHYLTGCGI